MKLLGTTKVTNNLNKQLARYNANSIVALQAAVAFIRADMEVTPPLIPVDFGNLRASWFTESIKNLQACNAVIFGFSANYAIYVHENIDADFTSTRIRYKPKRVYTPRKGAGPKFLEAALKRNTATILQIIKSHL